MKFSLMPFHNSITVPVAIDPLTLVFFWGRLRNHAPMGVPEENINIAFFIPSPLEPCEIIETIDWANRHIEQLRREIRREMIKPLCCN